MRSSLFCGLAAAIGLSLALSGCVAAAVDESEGDLGEVDSDLVAVTDEAPGDPGDVVEEGGDPEDPDPLPWTPASETNPTDNHEHRAALCGDPQDPDPLPWHPGTMDNNGSSESR